MRLVTKKSIKAKVPKKRIKKSKPQYGTSKLEVDFARDFLDKLGIEYIYQFEAKDIGRFYDFYLPKERILIEIDGDYFHFNPLVNEGKEMNRMQKKNKRVDELKDKWALLHGIPLMRIWEHDIRHNQDKVTRLLKDRLYISQKEDEKKRKHRKIL